MNFLNIITVIFLVILAFILFKNRKNIKREGIFIMYKTNLGIRAMDYFANKVKNNKLLDYFVYFMIIFSFIVSLFILLYLAYHTFSLLTKKTDIPGVSLIIPGVTEVAGISIPFWTILIIFIVALVHEFAHGLFARIYNMKVKNTGLVLLAIIPGAFVEIDEKLLEKKKMKEKLAIVSAGPFFNILLAFLTFLLIILLNKIPVDYVGVFYKSYNNSLLTQGVIYEINGELITYQDINEALSLIREEIKNRSSVSLLIKENLTAKYLEVPIIKDNNGEEKLGVYLYNSCELAVNKEICVIKDSIHQFLFFLFLFNIGIGTANLLPLLPLDGGKMFYFVFKKYKNFLWFLNILTLLLLLLNLLHPLYSKWL